MYANNLFFCNFYPSVCGHLAKTQILRLILIRFFKKIQIVLFSSKTENCQILHTIFHIFIFVKYLWWTFWQIGTSYKRDISTNLFALRSSKWENVLWLVYNLLERPVHWRLLKMPTEILPILSRLPQASFRLVYFFNHRWRCRLTQIFFRQNFTYFV